MFEGDDDDYKRQLKKAETNRGLDPHKMDELKRKYERAQRQDRSKLQLEIQKKKMEQDSRKKGQEMTKKGIVNINQKEDARKFMDDAKRKADAEKAQGQTENPSQAV